MPALGADMEVGTILEWLVKPGDTIKRGDIIAVVDTEKATIEVEVFETGIVQEIFCPAGRESSDRHAPGSDIRTDGEVVAPPAAKPKPAAAIPPRSRPSLLRRLDRRCPLAWRNLRRPRCHRRRRAACEFLHSRCARLSN